MLNGISFSLNNVYFSGLHAIISEFIRTFLPFPFFASFSSFFRDKIIQIGCYIDNFSTPLFFTHVTFGFVNDCF